MADITYSDEGFEAETFVALAKRVWPREYDLAAAAAALTRTTNIGAWDGERLVGAVRMLTDGYFFATVRRSWLIQSTGGGALILVGRVSSSRP